MNIAVLTSGGRVVSRPDTTWERKSDNVFLPEFVSTAGFTPVLFARISRPGKSIAERFAAKHYDAVNFGMLLYPMNLMDGAEGFAESLCLNHSSVLPDPLFNPLTLGGEDNVFSLRKDSCEIFRYPSSASNHLLDKAVSRVSEIMLIRPGDYLAVELDSIKPLLKAPGKCRIEGSWCSKETLSFEVIL